MRRLALLVALLAGCGPSAPPAASAEDAALMQQAIVAMHAADYTAVGQILAPLLERRTPPADALFVAGSAAYELQRYGDAVTLLTASCRAKPEFVSNSSALGFAHHKLGDFDAARRVFEQILEVAPDAYKAHYGLGLVALDQGLLEDARGHLERALALQPGYLKARFQFARLLQEEGRLEEARDALAALVDAWPSHEEALYRYARVLQQLGDEAGAKRVMARHDAVYAAKEALGGLVAQQRAGADSPQLRQQIVELWLQLGESDEARDACRAAIAAFPEDAGLKDLAGRVASLP